jgi:hypothetical protein
MTLSIFVIGNKNNYDGRKYQINKNIFFIPKQQQMSVQMHNTWLTK